MKIAAGTGGELRAGPRVGASNGRIVDPLAMNPGSAGWRLAAAALIALAIELVLNASSVQGVVIHESTLMGAAGKGSGYELRSNQFFGSRFRTDATVEVQAIGGHLLSTEGTLFGAIVSLTGPTALPSGTPFDASTVASTTFSVGTPSVDFRTPLVATLPPGDYALIFGSGEFGSHGRGFMPLGNTEGHSLSSYVSWGGERWWDLGVLRARFVVEGRPIHIPDDTYSTHRILHPEGLWRSSINVVDGWLWFGSVKDHACGRFGGRPVLSLLP